MEQEKNEGLLVLSVNKYVKMRVKSGRKRVKMKMNVVVFVFS